MRLILLLATLLPAQTLIPPTLLSEPAIPYPPQLYSEPIEGYVELELLVNESGQVENYTLTHPLHPLLDSLVQSHASTLTFDPATIDNEPVAVTLPWQVAFSCAKEMQKQFPFTFRVSGSVVVQGESNPAESVTVSITPITVKSGQFSPESILIHLAGHNKQWLAEKSLTTHSDSLGRFYFRGVPDGRYAVTVTGNAYLLAIDTVEIREKRFRPDTLYLTQKAFNPYETESRYRTAEHPSSYHISNSDIRESAGALKDPVRVAENLPGISKSENRTISLRGSNERDNRYFLDELEIPYLYHVGSMKSVIPGSMIKEMVVFPGSYGSYYGNTIGGIINCVTDTITDRFAGEIDLNPIDISGVIASKPRRNITLFAGARLSDKTGLTQRYLETVSDTVISPRYRDYIGRIDFVPHPRHTIRASFLGTHDSLLVSDIGTWTPVENRGYNRLSLTWNWKVSKRLDQTISYTNVMHQRRRQESQFMVYGQTVQRIQRSNFIRSRWDLAGKRATYSFGIHADNHLLFVGENIFIIDSGKIEESADTLPYDQGTLSPWGSVAIPIRDKLTLVTGLRYDYYHELNYSGSILPLFGKNQPHRHSSLSGDPSLRLSAMYRTGDHEITAAAGNYSQSPSHSFYTQDTIQDFHDLTSEKAVHYSAGYHYYSPSQWELSVQAYHHSRWDLMGYESDLPDQTEGYSRGIELQLSHSRSERWKGCVSYALSQSEIAFNHGWRATREDLRNAFKWSSVLFLPRQWELGMTGTVASGSRFTPLKSVIPSTVTIDGGFEVEGYDPVWGEIYSETLPTNLSVDLSFKKRVIMKKAKLELYSDLCHISGLIYNPPIRKLYNPELGRFSNVYEPFLPALGIRLFW